MFTGKRILVTGGLGFIGSNLCRRLLDQGADVTVVDSLIPEYGGNLFNLEHCEGRLQVHICDVRDEHAMPYHVRGKDLLFNLAGQTSHVDSMQNPFTDLEINARSQLSILEACRKHNRDLKIIFASTRQLYGKPHYLPVDERHPMRPVDVNGVNKLAGELFHQLYHDVHGIRSVVLRLTNTYGPRMRVKDARQTFLGIWIRRLLEGRPILVYGDGRQVRDYNYVDDVVDAMLASALDETVNGQTYNLGADDPLSLIDTAKTLIRLHGEGTFELVPFPADRKAIDIGDFYADYRAIRSRIGWKPKVPFDEGMGRTLEFYKQNLERYVESQNCLVA